MECKKIGLILCGLMLFVAVGCGPTWSVDGAFMPTPAERGKPLTITATVKGDLAQVGGVWAIPQDFPEYQMDLKDDGSSGDAKAGDGVYTFRVPRLPDEAPEGDYNVDFIVHNKEDQPIKVKQEGKEVDLSKTAVMVIK